MARTYNEVRRTVIHDHNNADHEVLAESQPNVAARVIYLIGGLIIADLALRFLLVLLGANHASGFVDFVYTTTQPFVAPFFGMFSYHTNFGISHFELETLFAIVVYALITWGLVRLTTLTDRHAEV